jgi:hypothetical protein
MCGISAIINPGHVTCGDSAYSTGGMETPESMTIKETPWSWEWNKPAHHQHPKKEGPGKRVEATLALFEVVEKNGDFLGDCWVQVKKKDSSEKTHAKISFSKTEEENPVFFSS